MLFVVAAQVDDLRQFFIIVIGVGQLHLFLFQDGMINRFWEGRDGGGQQRLVGILFFRLQGDIMEELLLQELEFWQPPSKVKKDGFGQTWEEINKGMRNALLLKDQSNQIRTQNQQRIDKAGQNHLPKIGHSNVKKSSKEPLKIIANECSDSRERLKIIKSITEGESKESYRDTLLKSNHSEDTFGFCGIPKGENSPTRANIIKLNVEEMGKDSRKAMERQHLKSLIRTSTIRHKTSEKENHEDLCMNRGLNVIKQESFQQQHRSKSQIGPNYMRIGKDNGQGGGLGFDKIGRNEHNQNIFAFTPVENSPCKVRRQRQKLPIINMEDIQRYRKSSLSIHATNSIQRQLSIHRSLPKNQGRYDQKREKQLVVRHKQQRQRQQVRKELRILLNPRLSRLKLVI